MNEPLRVSRLLPCTWHWLSLAAALAWTPLNAHAQRSARSGDHIVAVVNTESVTAIELEQRMARAKIDAQRGGALALGDDKLRQAALDALIEERVLLTYARESGTKIDDVELDRAVANIATQNQLNLDQLRERLRADGLDFQRFRSNIRDQMMLERVREREVMSRIRISDSDVDEVIAAQRTESVGDLELSLAQILVSVPDGATETQVAERRARAEQALARVRGGEDFARVAAELSEDPNRAAGGELGRRAAKRLPDLFVEATRDLTNGQVAPRLLRSPAGFHVLKVIDREAGSGFKVSQTRASHILLRVSERAPQAAVVARLEQLRRQIERGDRQFDVMARELSEDSSAAAGGDLGWASPGQFVPEFEEAMSKLSPGSISPPLVSRFGVHLIQVTDRRETSLEPKAVREQARNVLREQKFEQAFVDWAKDLRLRAYIEMREPPL